MLDIINEQGRKEKIEVIQYFRLESNKKEYVIYKNVGQNKNGYLIYAAELIERNDTIYLNTIKESKVLEEIKRIMEELNVRH